MRILAIDIKGQVETKIISADIDGIACELEGGAEVNKISDSFALFSSERKDQPVNNKAMVLLHLMSHSTNKTVRGNAFIAQRRDGKFMDLCREGEELFRRLLVGKER